jgi:hypothetical protein
LWFSDGFACAAGSHKKMEIGQNVLKVQLGNNQQDLLQDKKKAPRHSA